MLKHISLLVLAILAVIFTHAQNQRKIQRSWIRTNVTYLDGKEPQPDADTMYTRYTFSGSTLYISFYQAWDTYKQEWSSQHNQLTIGLDTYTIETLTDTSLTIALAGFRRVEFLSEEYLSSQDKNLVPQGEYNGKPLYLANNFITPRYSKRTSLYDEVQKDLEMSNIRQATNFLVTFVVTEEGKIENPQVVKSISPEYDRTIIERIQKTTKKWKPAYFKGKPVQTQLTYEVKYLPSIVPARSPLKIN